ncbi:outer membrane beta-barrel family protein [Elizabethkingia anophelis]|uniref:outer membrane beta-barrel family protein n=1 Tax=Elizabethkingia anophelis TaxID=1117645 RepID=UPI00136AD39A|nr:outer membrane beta-barrel family protein [Elizabethkingia anophelis]MCT4123656.1 TonB-dependent receptor [Elizabethkingia anophelis]MCT4325136.1 TonB-dependent receptor [Elizabethkingia anophelis]MYY42605.1 TonB-dependent receptor [Elizabethkingia anophelis]
MRLRKLWLLLLIILGLFIGKGQIVLKGKIVEAENKNPVNTATVYLLQGSQDSLQKTITDSLGQFQFLNLSPLNYRIEVSKTGFEKQIIPVEYKNSQQIDVGEIILKVIASSISEVVIIADRSTPRLNNSNLILRISNNKDFKTTINLYEVLRKTPGVQIDQDGGLLVGGRITPVVFVDGKPMLLSNQEVQNYLKSLTPDMVESIEINTNPSARYDAEYKGIIDIKLKRDKTVGWQGNAVTNLYQNKSTYNENNLNLTYRASKITIAGRGGYNTGIANYQYSALQHLANTDILHTKLIQQSDVKEYNIQTGIDVIPNNKHRVGILFRGNFLTQERSREGSLFSTNANGDQTVLDTYSSNPIHYRQKNLGVTLDYTLQLGKSKLSFIGNLLSVENKQKDDFINKDYINSDLLDYWKSNLLNKIKIYTGQVDYTKVLGNINLEAGAKLSFSNTNNNIHYEVLTNGNVFVQDSLRSNQFIYKEKIVAGYIAYNHKINKLNFSVGLRMEYTTSVSNAITVDSIVNRSYVKWLPSFDIGYSFSKNNQLSLSFSRKITRPLFNQLNPFRFYFSPLNYWIGNPYLQPSITSQFKIIYRQKSLVASFSFGKEEDVMTRYPLYDPKTNELAYLGTNLPYRNFANIEMSFPTKFFDWWNMNFQLLGYYNKEKNPYLGKIYAIDIYNYILRLNHSFSLPKGFILSLYTNYESKTGNSLYIIKPRYNIDIGLQKLWMNGKLNTKLVFNDIFNTYDQRLIFREKDIINNQFRHWNATQQLILTASYIFGNSNYKSTDRQRSEEENRTR